MFNYNYVNSLEYNKTVYGNCFSKINLYTYDLCEKFKPLTQNCSESNNIILIAKKKNLIFQLDHFMYKSIRYKQMTNLTSLLVKIEIAKKKKNKISFSFHKKD